MKILRFKKSILFLFGGMLLLVAFKKIEFTEPKISLENYTIEDGFELKVIASESFLKAPVSMDFDNSGRMWVVEMIGYMPNLEGIGEEDPTGRITILEDLDKDGITDHSKVFLDKLVLPRAIAHVYGGLLYSDGAKLWFTEIKNDKPGKKTLVDPLYADGGNVEHSSNGLMVGIDNWIYNADHNFRYRLKNGKWIKEPTSMRGQWGISKDDFGRLYFNNNSTQLQADFVLSNKVIRNKYFRPRESENQKLTNNRVFPLHATSVNRGYVPGVLDDNKKLMDVTASCGPLIYRGAAFPSQYQQNAFVCVPEANLIKRNTLDFSAIETKANQAIEGKEFLASTDEGFRPVNLFNGPDGAMYVVDMHRGIIQHKAYISQYLTEQLALKKLDTLQNAGRILKISHKNTALYAIPEFNKLSSKSLIGLLNNANGWQRDRAQQILIHKNDKSVVKELVNLAKTATENSAGIHAIYVLEGLNLLNFEILNDIIKNAKSDNTIIHALSLVEKFAIAAQIPKFTTSLKPLLAKNDRAMDMYIALSLQPWLKISESTFLPILNEIAQKYPNDKIIKECIISSLEDKEEVFIKKMNPNQGLKNSLETVVKNRKQNEMNPIFVKLKNDEDGRTRGLRLFRTICATCHGADGKGIENLAPPLKGSEYVDGGSMKRLASIILHGISGPMHVGGKLYELNNDMPGLINNSSISDQDIVEIISFMQNAYAKEPKRISVGDLKKLRELKPIGGVYNEKQLLEGTFD